MLNTVKPVFDIEPDFSKSFGSKIFCKKKKRHYLDFFSLFSSLPFGYNPSFLKLTDFYSNSQEFLSIRNPLCAFNTSVKSNYINTLYKLNSIHNNFTSVLFSETGALAVELAIKVFTINSKHPIYIYTIQNSYHGIYGLAGGLTIGSGSAYSRLKKLEDLLPGFNCVFKTITSESDFEEISDIQNSVLIIEPIQCTSGDISINQNIVDLIKEKQKSGLTLIVDEIQTGYLSTGTFWSYEKFNLNPDMVVFGKKFQVCGCLLQSKYNHLLDVGQPKYFSSTFDSSMIDMLRGTYFNMHLTNNYNFYKNRVQEISGKVSSCFMDKIEPNNIRINGLFFAIDFLTSSIRDKVVRKLQEEDVLSNPTGERSIRFRSNLETSNEELDLLLEIISHSI